MMTDAAAVPWQPCGTSAGQHETGSHSFIRPGSCGHCFRTYPYNTHGSSLVKRTRPRLHVCSTQQLAGVCCQHHVLPISSRLLCILNPVAEIMYQQQADALQ